MQFAGRYAIAATQDAVWAALNDAEVLRRCIPGCESLEKAGDNTFAGAAKIKIGPVSATFRGKVELTEQDPPRRCVLKGEGQGGVAGFARGESEVLLEPQDGGTILSYNAKATIGGKLAQVGQRLVDGAARQIADQFFERFSTEVTTMQTPAATSTSEHMPEPPPKVAQQPPASVGTREGLAPEIWVVGLIAIIVILLILFGLVL